MILPLGLGFKFFRIPFVTIALCVICIGLFFRDPTRAQKVNDEILKVFAAQNMGPLENQLFQEYCGHEGGTATNCAEIGQFLESSYDSAEVRKARKAKSKNTKDRRFAFEKDGHDQLKYFSIIGRFQKLVQKPDENFENLVHFESYEDGLTEVRNQVTSYYKKENLLSSKNLNLLAVLIAQFSHASVSHLFGNLIFLFLFGAYVEARVGAVIFLMAYLIGGSAGLAAQVAWFSPPEQYLVGASANVSAVMGMFFVLFFRFRMKFLVWYLVGRTFYAPVSYTFPFLFILSEIVGGLQGITYGGTDVAHFAHLGGILFGMYAAFMVGAIQEVPWPFLYSDEPSKYKKMKLEDGLVKKLAAGREILKYNPQNYVTRRYLLTQCLEQCNQQPLVDAKVLVFLRENGLLYLDDCARNKNDDACFKFLGMFPNHLPFFRVLEGINPGSTIKLGDAALRRGDLFLAMKLYDFFLMRFPTSRKVKSLKMTTEEVVKHLPHDAATDRCVELYRRAHPESAAVLFWDARGVVNEDKTMVLAAS